MADKYDSNGDYGTYADNFKRKSINEKLNESGDADNDESNPAAQKAGEYVRELLAEKLTIDQNKQPNACRLIDQEIAKVQAIGKIPPKDVKYVDIYREKPIKVTVKVLVPVREHPKFNFVGKLLGPKGNSMKRLQEETMCKMAVLGKGSMKDRQKEEELRNSLDPKYAHLSDDLHVEISALGPPAEAHARIAFALAEVRKYLIPDNNDNIRQEQMREMEIMTSSDIPIEEPRSSRRAPGIIRAAIPRPAVPMRTATRTPVVTPRVMPAKTKIMSILDRARIAMEESYGFEDSYEPAEVYEPYSSSVSHSRSYSTHHYEPDYEPEYYRESSSSYVKQEVVKEEVFSESENEMDEASITPEILEEEGEMMAEEEGEKETKTFSFNLLPERSRKKYEAVYKAFMDWRERKDLTEFSESVLLAYFEELAEKYKSSSLWAYYSMLRSTLNVNNGVNIENYKKLNAFLKHKSEGYQAKKAKTLTANEIRRFINEAPDDTFLATKVALIMGITGACRVNDLNLMRVQNVQDLGSAMLVTVPKGEKSGVRKFAITDQYYDVCKKYASLRPPDAECSAFFLGYQNGKCTGQKIGKNKFGSMGKLIAKYLKLPNPEMYTGHMFRKSSKLFGYMIK